jgi:hypothetical protein
MLIRPILLAAVAIALAAPAFAQTRNAPGAPADAQRRDSLQRMYDAPLRRMYEDPLRKIYPDTSSPFGKAPQIYGSNPLIPGGQPTAPTTMNAPPPAVPAAPPLPPGMITGDKPYGEQDTFDPRFRRFDANNDGQLSRDEYQRMQMLRAPSYPAYADTQRGSLQRRFDNRFGAADTNRNGRLDRQEYNGATNPRF